MSLDAKRVEAALREVVSHLDYDLHKYTECDEDEGKDHYPDVTQQFIKAYEATPITVGQQLLDLDWP